MGRSEKFGYNAEGFFHIFFSASMDSGLVIWIVGFALCIAVHESAHALTAYWLGDPTAKNQGRITLNPLKHIDPLGLLFLIIARFGWAKPVQINDQNFVHPRLYTALTAAAGPLSNILLAYLSIWIAQFFPDALLLLSFLQTFFLLNIFLAVFNLLPIFPLDGEKILALFVPRRFHAAYDHFAQHGPLILFGIIGVDMIFGWNLFSKILIPMANYVATFLQLLVFVN